MAESAGHLDQPGPFQSDEDVGRLLDFLTGPVLFVDSSSGSVTPGRDLVLSYASIPKYWGEYVCKRFAFPPSECAYMIEAGWENGNWYQRPRDTKASSAMLAVERSIATAGADVYDAAAWQIALALAAAKSPPSAATEKKFTLIENQNRHLTDPKYRATGSGFLYGYRHQIRNSDSSAAFYFRISPKDFLNTDPLWTDEEFKYFISHDPTVEVDKLGQISWMDWKPITGENVWAFFLGPIHADRLRFRSRGFVPFANLSIQNAIGVLDAFSHMQSATGAFYYAPDKTLGNTGELVPRGEISVENNASALAGLRVLQDGLEASLEYDQSLTANQRVEIQRSLSKVFTMLYGGITVGGFRTQGLIAFFREHAYDAKLGIFVTHGTAPDPQAVNGWVPAKASDALAVDANTWSVSALGPATVDAWWGHGTAHRIWNNVRGWGGYFGPSDMTGGSIWGVGFSNQDSNSIMSAEWTAGAITMLQMLIAYYEAHPGLITSEQLAALRVDEQSMLTNLSKLRSDNYARAGFNDSVPEEFLPSLDDDLAFLYASKRYLIPFGWFANPIPSTTATSWAIMLHFHYNPLQPGGMLTSDIIPEMRTIHLPLMFDNGEP